MVKGATEEVEDLANSLPGPLGTPAATDLSTLLDEDPEPDPVTVWRLWKRCGRPTEDDLERCRDFVDAESVEGFDPAEDRPNTASKVKAANAYEDALEADLEAAAGFLRTLDGRKAEQFAMFLRREYL